MEGDLGATRDIELVWDVQGRVTESPVWDPALETVWFADLRAGVVFAYGVRDHTRRSWRMPDQVGSLGLCASGRLVVAVHRRIAFLDPDSGDVAWLTDEVDEPPGNRFNDGKVGPDGAFWVGTRDARRGQGDGRVAHGNGGLWRVTPDARMERRTSGYATSNGLAWSPDGRTMYHSDSHNGVVDAWDFDPATGEIENQRRFLDLQEEDGRPDGAACDTDGNYWSAGISAGCLNVFAPDGRLRARIDTPFPAPSMVCFGDGEVFVTANARDTPPSELRHRYNVGGLFRMPTLATGAPIARFDDDRRRGS